MMQCPYCGKDMVKGTILGDRYQLKWMPEDKGLLLGIWAHGSVALGKGGGLIGRPKVESFFCESCKKMVIDLDSDKN